MELIPAIDLIEGGVVRLLRGDGGRRTSYPQDPVELALSLAGAGVPRLHVVDLEGAFAGGWRNLDVVRRIAGAVDVPVQVGGGARTRAAVLEGLRAGASRVVVGTAALESPELVGAWARELEDGLVVSLDGRGRRLLGRAWTSDPGRELVQLATALREAGVRRFVQTEVARDGALEGVDLAGLAALRPLGLPVLVAGGVTGLQDVASLRAAGAEGAIVGRALLEGRLDLGRALEAASGPP
ncbi:MAG: HisA/HisF-related TIM barrel protein, partial [Candidatus Dormibacterales bacterium]